MHAFLSKKEAKVKALPEWAEGNHLFQNGPILPFLQKGQLLAQKYLYFIIASNGMQ